MVGRMMGESDGRGKDGGERDGRVKQERKKLGQDGTKLIITQPYTRSPTYPAVTSSGASLNSKKELLESPSSHFATVSPSPIFDNLSIRAGEIKIYGIQRFISYIWRSTVN
jgi:hypothetical protein